METLWQAEGSKLREGAQQFAREYWAQPRKIRDFAVREDATATFNMVGGTGRIYVAAFRRGTFGTLVVVSTEVSK